MLICWKDPAAADDDDADSALGVEAPSTTASLSSSVLHYRQLQGRTFHSDIGNAAYWGTNDAGHNESLDMLHHMCTLCLDGKLFEAPVTDPKAILDIGTGTGVWAIDVGDKFPDCDVIGTDVSPSQPSWIPPNVQFQIDDCTQEWTFAANHFDLIHIRYLIGSIIDWPALFKEAFKATKPGGYLESYEVSPTLHSDDESLPADSALAQWGSIFIDGALKTGRSCSIVDDHTQITAMTEAGFVDIKDKWIKVPYGTWPAKPNLREIGAFAQHAVLSDVDSFILQMADLLGWSTEKRIVYGAQLRKESKSSKYHAYFWQRVVYGRKPDAE